MSDAIPTFDPRDYFERIRVHDLPPRTVHEDDFSTLLPHRYDQCDDTCTTDCGHCKEQGRPVGEVLPDAVVVEGAIVTPPTQARHRAAFAPLLDKIGPGAGAMVEREMDRARAFEVIARAAVAYIEADGALDPYGSDYEALSEAIEENAWAVRP